MTVPATAAAEPHRLLELVNRARTALGEATTAAEVLDARDEAALIYDAAKAAARFAKAKGAHDELIAAAHRAQADALEIEAQAKRRLADEYDAAQERGEVQGHGGQGKRDVPERNIPAVTDLGLTRKAIHEARQLRDAEAADPGVIRRTLDARLADGHEPTKAAVRAAVETVLPKPPSNVIPLGDRLTVLPTPEAIERGLIAQEAAEEIAGIKDYDLKRVDHRAKAVNYALGMLEHVPLTGKEYWRIYGKSPKREAYIKWAMAAKALIDDIVEEHQRVTNL